MYKQNEHGPLVHFLTLRKANMIVKQCKPSISTGRCNTNSVVWVLMTIYVGYYRDTSYSSNHVQSGKRASNWNGKKEGFLGWSEDWKGFLCPAERKNYCSSRSTCIFGKCVFVFHMGREGWTFRIKDINTKRPCSLWHSNKEEGKVARNIPAQKRRFPEEWSILANF